MIARKMIAVLVFTLILLGSSAYSQNDHYLGKEANITNSELLNLADKVNFNGELFAKVYEDKKNTYYAIDSKAIESRYVKIRILEQSFTDTELVNIGSFVNDNYMLFLMNNVINKSEKDILNQFNSYHQTAVAEESSMNEQDMNEWLINHDKYSKK